MMENFGEKTPGQVRQVIIQCFDLMNELKQTNRDKKSREWFEKLKLSKDKIEKELDVLKDFDNEKLNSIKINDTEYNYTKLKDYVFDLLFMFFMLNILIIMHILTISILQILIFFNIFSKKIFKKYW